MWLSRTAAGGSGKTPTNKGLVIAIGELVLHEYLGPNATKLVAGTRRSENGLCDLKIDQW